MPGLTLGIAAAAQNTEELKEVMLSLGEKYLPLVCSFQCCLAKKTNDIEARRALWWLCVGTVTLNVVLPQVRLMMTQQLSDIVIAAFRAGTLERCCRAVRRVSVAREINIFGWRFVALAKTGDCASRMLINTAMHTVVTRDPANAVATLKCLQTLHGFDIDITDASARNTMLHYAMHGMGLASRKDAYTALSAWLLENGASTSVYNTSGHTPLLVGANAGSAAAVGMALKFGADALAPGASCGKTALNVAATAGDVAMVQVLVDHAAERGVTLTLLGKADDVELVPDVRAVMQLARDRALQEMSPVKAGAPQNKYALTGDTPWSDGHSLEGGRRVTGFFVFENDAFKWHAVAPDADEVARKRATAGARGRGRRWWACVHSS